MQRKTIDVCVDVSPKIILVDKNPANVLIEADVMQARKIIEVGVQRGASEQDVMRILKREIKDAFGNDLDWGE